MGSVKRASVDPAIARTVAAVLPLAVLLVGVGIGFGVWGDGPRLAFSGLRDAAPLLTLIMQGVTEAGEAILLLTYAALLVRAGVRNDMDLTRFVMIVIVCLCLTKAATYGLKTGLGLPRPGIAGPPLPLSGHSDYESFPSGHTMTVIVLALPLIFRIPSKAIAACLSILIVLVALSRLWLGRHHPIDVAGSLAFGTAIAVGICVLVGRWSPPAPDRRKKPGRRRSADRPGLLPLWRTWRP